MLALAATLPAFSPAAAAPALSPARASSPMMVERSKALPFLKKPPALDGMPPRKKIEEVVPLWPLSVAPWGPLFVVAS